MSIPKSRLPNSARQKTARTTQYFEPEPQVASRPRTVKMAVGEAVLELQADRGVFGSRGVDLGTRTLLREAPPPPAQGELLDLGCGYGPIAIHLALAAPSAHVWAIDVNGRAIELARSNAAAAHASNLTACTPEEVPEAVSFDAIYSNPPVRVGKAALHEILLRWLPRLRPGAPAYLVVQRNLGADSLATWLESQGFQVGRLKSKKGFRILEVRSAAS